MVDPAAQGPADLGASWAGRLLVATPQLTEPTFARTVILVLQCDSEDGALGLVLNRPSGTAVAEVLEAWAPLAADPGVVFVGGPVAPHAAICLGRGRPGAKNLGAYSVLDGAPGPLGTVDLDAAVAEVETAVAAVRVFAGYAGWAAGQLETEVEQGAWWVLDALPTDAFTERPETLWRTVLRRQGAPLAFAAGYPDDPRLN